MGHILWPMNDPRDPSVNWPVTRVTRDPWPMTHDFSPVTVTVVTIAYPREREGSIDEISISYCAYVLPPVHNKFSSHQLIFHL